MDIAANQSNDESITSGNNGEDTGKVTRNFDYKATTIVLTNTEESKLQTANN